MCEIKARQAQIRIRDKRWHEKYCRSIMHTYDSGFHFYKETDLSFFCFPFLTSDQ